MSTPDHKDQLQKIANLTDAVPGLEVSVSYEAKPAEPDGDRKLRLFKQAILFCLAVAFSAAIGGICIWTVVSPTSTPDDKKWATAILTSMTSALVAWLVK